MGVVTADTAAHGRPPLALDARDVAGRLLVGAAAGALAGAVVGGIAGRLVMLVLRLASDPSVLGVTSDDGFEIGRFTLDGSVNLAGGMAAAGAANGALYVALRSSIPARLRAVVWSAFAAAVGGSQIVHADGVDFTLLEPLWFAVVSFVALPGLAALLVVLLVERWLRPGRQPRPLLLALGAALGTVAPALVAVLWLAVLVVRRAGVAGLAARLGRVVVPAGLAIGIAAGAWYTLAEAAQILG